MSFSVTWIFAFLVAVVITAITRTHRSRLPPGPRGIPFLGNVLNVPKNRPHLTYAKWSRQYSSGILYLNLVGTPIIIVNSAKDATELFDRRSSIYSDRTQFVMMNELMGWSFTFAFKRYGDEWREQRRLFSHHFNAQAIVKYRPRVVHEVRTTLNHLLGHSDDFLEQLRHMAGSLILSVTYGIKVLPKGDPYIAIAEEALSGLAASGNAGSYLVDSIPALKYLPAWFPGAEFKRQAAMWRKPTLAMAATPFAAVKRAMANGTASVSVVSSLLSEVNVTEDSAKREATIRDVAAAAYAAGSDTSVSVLGTVILAMLLHPEVQRKAQAELDRVVGHDRLPEFDDEDNLPYITAIYREAMRWRPVTPLAPAHRVTRDDEYMGYHVPGGAVVIGNVWAILHDESRYHDPDTFNPDRFLTKDGALDPSVPNPEEFAFGFGRRICPGRYLAASTIWLGIASILATFDLEMPTDEHGQKIKPSGEYTLGLAVMPVSFDCVFKPRSAHATALIRAAAHEMDL